MPESVCEELLDELFDNPFLTFADYLSLLREANKDQRERPERKTGEKNRRERPVLRALYF
ncbi:hypothetical protein OAP51_06585 [Alphaproteobacteria bacterium]|nr:hypothetical protein [Alphaproteobacteria bacterium]